MYTWNPPTLADTSIFCIYFVQVDALLNDITSLKGTIVDLQKKNDSLKLKGNESDACVRKLEKEKVWCRL